MPARSPAPRAAACPAPPFVRDVFAAATRHHRAGELTEAARLYGRVLAHDGAHADSLHLLGVVAHAMGRDDLATDLIGQAIALAPDSAGYHASLGAARAGQGDAAGAEASYRRAIALAPDNLEAHNNLGTLSQAAGRYDEAIACYRAALALAPDLADCHYNLGVSLQCLERTGEAAACYRRAIAARPDHADAHHNLGVALGALGQTRDAIISLREAAALRPGHAATHVSLGHALREAGRPEEAAACYRAALALRPDDADSHNNLGLVLTDLRLLDAAADRFRAALERAPSLFQANNNLGIVRREQGRLDDAIACFRAALARRPDSPEAHKNLAMALLARGDFPEGWREFEWRWRVPGLRDHRPDIFAIPRWRGEATAPGKTLLIHAEQGFGDTIQFCRYAPLAAARGFRVILEVQPSLVRLLEQSLPGLARVVARGDAFPAGEKIDLQCAMLSLPLAFATTLDTVPVPKDPVLRADPRHAARWRERLTAPPGTVLRVGLAWAGAAGLPVDARRSVPPALLAPLFAVPGVQFVSLTKDGPPAPCPLTDVMADVDDFADTAALVANLDLVISVDTAVAHLAAALGTPVWLLDRFDSCWRWLHGRRDSPWYPTLRLYRQPSPGDWTAVVTDVARDLVAAVAAREAIAATAARGPNA